ncbi:unannotated protein [freshwater metagenome]|uniref:Unannotated protein n=1 Tax=freshwater metagenome TaxID=449393 RepID=A0A6J6HBU6_9ZZZZ|nr:hypothetical protein [Actinomycetota bacterium]
MTPPFVVSHWIATTPEKVWEAYTTPEIFHQFFAPDGLHVPLDSVNVEIRVGGRFDFNMVFDDTGVVNENRGVIVELQEPNKMVFSEPEFMGSELRSTQAFDADNGGTRITVTQDGLPEELIGNPEVIEAFRSTFRKLGRVLDVDTENR